MELDSILEAAYRGAIGGAAIAIVYFGWKYLKPKVKQANEVAKEKNNKGISFGKFNLAITDLLISLCVIGAFKFMFIYNTL